MLQYQMVYSPNEKPGYQSLTSRTQSHYHHLPISTNLDELPSLNCHFLI